MTNHEHVVSEHNRNLLSGNIPADRDSISFALDIMLDEQEKDANSHEVEDKIFFSRAGYLNAAIRAYNGRNYELAGKRIALFYSI